MHEGDVKRKTLRAIINDMKISVEFAGSCEFGRAEPL
jgi:hypothetical protein